jgi:hypothetical protein
MAFGISVLPVAIVCVAVVGLFVVARRKSEGNARDGEPGAQAVKLGRLY